MSKAEDFLIRLVSEGDEKAFDRLMDVYSPPLYNYAYGIIGNKELAEEVVSDVFLDLWKLGGAISEINNLKSFLNTVVYRKSISCIRKENVTVLFSAEIGAKKTVAVLVVSLK